MWGFDWVAPFIPFPGGPQSSGWKIRGQKELHVGGKVKLYNCWCFVDSISRFLFLNSHHQSPEFWFARCGDQDTAPNLEKHLIGCRCHFSSSRVNPEVWACSMGQRQSMLTISFVLRKPSDTYCIATARKITMLFCSVIAIYHDKSTVAGATARIRVEIGSKCLKATAPNSQTRKLFQPYIYMHLL